MKPKAILFNLWDKHLSVIKDFGEKIRDHIIIVPHSGFLDYPPFQSFVGRIIPLDQLISQGDQDVLADSAREKTRQVQSFMKSESWKTYCDGRGKPEDDIAGALLEGMESGLFQQMLQIERLDKALEKLDIRAAVVNEEFTLLPKCMVIWAKSKNIPVLHINHSLGMIGWYTVCDTILSDALAIYGRIVADGPMETGLGGNRIFTSGNPDWIQYQRAMPGKAAFRQDIRARHFPGSDAPLVVFGTNWNAFLTATAEDHDTNAQVKAFFRAIASLRKKGRSVVCVLKLRSNNPRSMEAEFSEIAAQEGLPSSSYRFVRDGLESLMLGADAVVSIDSTLSTDALMADTTAINLTTEIGWRMGPYFPNYTGILESTPEDLADCLERALWDEEVGKSLKDMRRRSRDEFQGIRAEGEISAYFTGLIERMGALPGKAPQTRPPKDGTDLQSYPWEAGGGGSAYSLDLGDSLERDADPVLLMSKASLALADGGEIRCTIRNVSHWPIIRSLVEGRWPLPEGVDQIRFFTLLELESFFGKHGFSITGSVAEAGKAPDEDFRGFLEAVAGGQRSPVAHSGVRKYTVSARKTRNSMPVPAPQSVISCIGPATGQRLPKRAGKMTIVIWPSPDPRIIAGLTKTLAAMATLATEVICLAYPSQLDGLRGSLPGEIGVHAADEGNLDSQSMLRRLAERMDGDYLAMLDPGTILAPGWDGVISRHLGERCAAAPLVNLAGGTQCIYHYLPPQRVDPEDVGFVSREVGRRFPRLALSANWLHDQCLVFGRDTLAAMAALEDEGLDGHFLGLSRKLRLAGAKLLVAKDAYAYLQP